MGCRRLPALSFPLSLPPFLTKGLMPCLAHTMWHQPWHQHKAKVTRHCLDPTLGYHSAKAQETTIRACLDTKQNKQKNNFAIELQLNGKTGLMWTQKYQFKSVYTIYTEKENKLSWYKCIHTTAYASTVSVKIITYQSPKQQNYTS